MRTNSPRCHAALMGHIALSFVHNTYPSNVCTRFAHCHGSVTDDFTHRVKWGKTPSLRIKAHILITNGRNSLTLIDNKGLTRFLICRDFLGKIYDIVEKTPTLLLLLLPTNGHLRCNTFQRRAGNHPIAR